MFLIMIMYMTLALSFVAAKYTLIYAKPFFLIAVRMLIAGGFLLGHQWFYGERKLFKRARIDWLSFLKVGFLHIYCAFALEFWALQYMTALKTVLIYSATPFITAILAYFITHEQLSVRKIVGMMVGIVGFIPLFAVSAQEIVPSSSLAGVAPVFTFGPLSLPEIALSGAVFSAAYAWFHVKRLLEKDYSFVFVNGVAMVIGGLLCSITSLIVEGITQSPVTAIAPFLFWLGLLILLSNVIFYNLYGYLIKKYSMTFLSLCGFLCPLFSTLLEWLLLGGTVGWHHLFCLCFVTAGLFIFYGQSQ